MKSMPETNRRYFIGIFIAAFSGLAYQVLLTRIFSVVLYYHFAFGAISLAMLGLTVGALRVYLYKERFSTQRWEKEWSKAALNFSISSVGLVFLFLYAPLMLPEQAILPVEQGMLPFFVIPFIYNSICITLILTRPAFPLGKLYAADLIGAALGCIGIVCFLFFLDPISIILGLGALTAFSAWYILRNKGSLQLTSFAGLLALGWLFACMIQGGLYLTDNAHLRVLWAKSQKQEGILFERWNTFSRIRVSDYFRKTPYGWGFGHEQTAQIEQRYLDIDADASTIITRFDGDVKPLAYLADDVINMGYHVRPVSEVAVIGVGGGRDVMSALYFGVHKVTGIELNPAIFEVLTKRFAEFTGYFYRRPDVRLVNAEARSWLNQEGGKYDLIQISLIDTWAATAAGGLTLTENRLYTVEAWKEFLSHLNPQGMLTVSRWFLPKDHKEEFYRLLSLAVESLEGTGVPATDVRKHILVFGSGRIITMVVSPGSFSAAEINKAEQTAKELGFYVMIDLEISWDKISGTIASGQADTNFYNTLPFDVNATTDNRPFFFFTTRLKDFLSPAFYSMNSNLAEESVVVLLGFALIVTLWCIVLPMIGLAKQSPVKDVMSHLFYFCAIGMGFMMIEISQMQRLMVFLGHPVYGLSVVLFTLLIFGGMGSATVHLRKKRQQLWIRPLLLVAVLCVIGEATPLCIEFLKVYDTPIRILASVALLAPVGFCMGMMFPVGMMMSARHAALQPWFWGVNGATSVFASMLGMAVSMQYGITNAYWTGVACYVVCAVLAIYNTKEAL